MAAPSSSSKVQKLQKDDLILVKRENQPPSSTRYIPIELIEIILSKLPIKDVLRLKSASISWSASIPNPRFSRLHLENGRQITDDDRNQLYVWPSLESAAIYHLGRFDWSTNTFEVVSRLKCPIIIHGPSPPLCSYGCFLTPRPIIINGPSPPPQPLCSCDGFFLIYESVSRSCLVWNPMTQSNFSFAYPSEIMKGPHETTHGLCYDPSEDDYKVVFVNWVSMLYTVFSCRNNSWTEPEKFPYLRLGAPKDPGHSVGGIPYWVVVTDDVSVACIAYFDAKERRFKELNRPDELARKCYWLRLTDFNGRLCLYAKEVERIEGIWVLLTHENSWKRLPLVEDSVGMEWWSMMTMKKLLLTEDGSVHTSYMDFTFIAPGFLILDHKDSSKVCRFTGPKEIASEVIAVRATLAVLPSP